MIGRSFDREFRGGRPLLGQLPGGRFPRRENRLAHRREQDRAGTLQGPLFQGADRGRLHFRAWVFEEFFGRRCRGLVGKRRERFGGFQPHAPRLIAGRFEHRLLGFHRRQGFDRFGANAVGTVLELFVENRQGFVAAQFAQSGDGGPPHGEIGIGQVLPQILEGLRMFLRGNRLERRDAHPGVAVGPQIGRFDGQFSALARRPCLERLQSHVGLRTFQRRREPFVVGRIFMPRQAANQFRVQIGIVSRGRFFIVSAVLIDQFLKLCGNGRVVGRSQGFGRRAAHGERQIRRLNRLDEQFGSLGHRPSGLTQSPR